MQPVLEYTLPPDKLAQAIAYSHAQDTLYFASTAISLLALVAILRLRIVPRLRGKAGAVVVAVVFLLTSVFELPADIWEHAISLRYRISIESWPAWFWDWTKAEMVLLILTVMASLPFYALIRRSPRRWWIYAWLVSIPVMLVSAYADPLILEPLFNRFVPLESKHPELIAPIERLLDRAGVRIARDHLYEMEASDKTNSLNAYISGFGSSRRIVLYDTIIKKEQGQPLLTTIGHEVGHYVLQHIPKGLALGAFSLLFGFLALFLLLPWFINRWGPALDIRGVGDWASLPALLLFAGLVLTLAEPVANAYSRRQEKEADLFSLEVTHGMIADPGQAAAQALQVEGETDLEEPHPNSFIVFWLYSHPPVAERVRYSLAYDPWKTGGGPRYVK